MMEKLVRDRIPEIMKRNGVDPQVREANQGERLRLLLAKLHEEASEVTIPRQSRGHSGCEPLKAAVRGR